MVVAAIGLGAVAVTAQIRRHHGEMPGEIGRHAIPGQMREWITVQQKQRRPLAAVAQDDVDAVHMQRFLFEIFHHRPYLPVFFSGGRSRD